MGEPKKERKKSNDVAVGAFVVGVSRVTRVESSSSSSAKFVMCDSTLSGVLIPVLVLMTSSSSDTECIAVFSSSDETTGA